MVKRVGFGLAIALAAIIGALAASGPRLSRWELAVHLSAFGVEVTATGERVRIEFAP